MMPQRFTGIMEHYKTLQDTVKHYRHYRKYSDSTAILQECYRNTKNTTGKNPVVEPKIMVCIVNSYSYIAFYAILGKIL